MKPTREDREAAFTISNGFIGGPSEVRSENIHDISKVIARHMAPEREQWATEQVKWGEEVAELRRMVADERERARREGDLRKELIKHVKEDHFHEDIAGLPKKCPGVELCCEARFFAAAEALDKEGEDE